MSHYDQALGRTINGYITENGTLQASPATPSFLSAATRLGKDEGGKEIRWVGRVNDTAVATNWPQCSFVTSAGTC